METFCFFIVLMYHNLVTAQIATRDCFFDLGNGIISLMESAKRFCGSNTSHQSLSSPFTEVVTANRQRQTKLSYECAYMTFVTWYQKQINIICQLQLKQ